jgi:Xaa-Pro aminopeptidase
MGTMVFNNGAHDKALSEQVNDMRGHNNPPEPTAFEAISIHIDDLMETAQGFLDGDAVTTQAVADEIGRLLDEARQAEKAAEAQRKIEAEPFDKGKAEVQARYKPLAGKCELIASTAKKALAPFLAAEQAKRDAEAAEARRAADAAAEAARAAIQAADATDLTARAQAEALLKDASKLDRTANAAGKQKAMVAGGARSVSLRSVWSPELTDPMAALKHYIATQPVSLKYWLLEQARSDVAAGKRSIPGFEITETKVAQ